MSQSAAWLQIIAKNDKPLSHVATQNRPFAPLKLFVGGVRFFNMEQTTRLHGFFTL